MTKTNEYWIWKSEKGKNTCEKCKSLDGKIFYSEDEIPEKPHPNCKCEVVKVVAEEKYEKCDCKELLNKIQNAVENIIAETKTYLGTIQEINTDCEINKESLQDLLNKAYVIKDEYENELAKHLKTCANNKDEEYKEITQKIIDFEKLKKENETNSAKIYELNKNFQNFDKETRVHLVDIQQLKEYSADTPHKKDECKILEDVLDLQTKTKLVNSQFQDYKKQAEMANLKNKNIQNAINSGNSYIKVLNNIPKIKCKCSNFLLNLKIDSFYSTGANTIGKKPVISGDCLQNALNWLEPAKKNKDAKVLNSIDDIKNKNLKNALDKIKMPKYTRGIVYNSNSKQSKNLLKTKEVQKFLSENMKALKENKKFEIQDLEFNPFKDWDAYLALQKCKMYNPHITKDGYFEAMIYDYYDFEHREPDPNAKGVIDKIFNPLATKVNNWGHRMQERKLLENYFVIYHIREKI